MLKNTMQTSYEGAERGERRTMQVRPRPAGFLRCTTYPYYRDARGNAWTMSLGDGWVPVPEGSRALVRVEAAGAMLILCRALRFLALGAGF